MGDPPGEAGLAVAHCGTLRECFCSVIELRLTFFDPIYPLHWSSNSQSLDPQGSSSICPPGDTIQPMILREEKGQSPTMRVGTAEIVDPVNVQMFKIVFTPHPGGPGVLRTGRGIY